MQLLQSLLRRETLRTSLKNDKLDVDFVVDGMKCHREDSHIVKGLDSQGEVPPFSSCFSKSLLRGNMLAVANEEGGVSLFDARKQGSSGKLKEWTAHSNAIFDLAWVCDEAKLVTASGDQTAQMWDVQQSTRLAVFRGHSCSLKSVDFQHDNTYIFATGARDGHVMVWDTRCNKRDGYYQPVNTIYNGHSTLLNHIPRKTKGRRRSSVTGTQHSQQSVTSVKFQDVNMVISAGAVDGNIKVWDLRKNYSTFHTKATPYHIFPYPESGTRKHGYSSLSFDSNKSKLFANSTNDAIYMFDCITHQMSPLATFKGHSNTTFYVKSCISPDDQYLLSGSGDYDGYIWKINDPTAAPFHLTGHANEVTSVAWCSQDQTKIVTCSDDNTVKIWRVNFEEQNGSDFVGWCERKPNPRSITPEEKGKSSNNLTPSSSPLSRSQNRSISSSPTSLSPKAMKCTSPQQVLQSWLQPNKDDASLTLKCNENNNTLPNSSTKRPRDSDNATRMSKRYCTEGELFGATNEMKDTRDKNCLSLVEYIKNPPPSDETAEANKENVQVDFNAKDVSEQSFVNANESQSHSGIVLKRQSSSELENTILLPEQSDQQECSNAVTKSGVKKTNWLRDMGVKKSVQRKRLQKQNLQNEDVIWKDRSASEPNSPLIQKPSCVDKSLRPVLKTTKSIRNYFLPDTRAADS